MKPKRPENMGRPLRWALEASMDPAMAAADWLAREIEPACMTAVELLTARDVAIAKLDQAKEAFKTMRVVGETSDDRRIGARLYAASIAAGLVYHNRRISRQSDAAVGRALRALAEDAGMPEPLRTLAGTAYCRLLETGSDLEWADPPDNG